MHNWKRSGHGLGYVLAALMVVSCGGGGGNGVLSLPGTSTNSMEFVTANDVPVPLQGGTSAVVLKITDKNGNGVANQLVSLSITGPGKLNVASATTSAVPGAVGEVTFQIIGGDSVGSGTVTATYTDASGNEAPAQTIKYSVVDPTSAPSVYTIGTPSLIDANGAAITGNLLLPTSGNTTATIKVSVLDPTGKTTNKGKLQFSFPTGFETGKGALSPASPSFVQELDASNNPVFDAKGNPVYSASVVLDAAAQAVGDNRVVVTYTDTLGSKATTSIPFAIINQFNVLLTADKSQLKTGGDSLNLIATVVNGASARVQNQNVTFQIGAGMPASQAPCPSSSTGIGDASQFVASRSLTFSQKGGLSKSTVPTDENGQAKVVYDVNDWRNGSRRVYAVVDAGTGSQKPVACLDINLTGTTIQLQPEIINTGAGGAFSVTAAVKNGLGNPVANVPVELSGTGISASKSVNSAANGVASFSLNASAAGGEISAASPSASVTAENADATPVNKVSVGVSSKNIAVDVLDGASAVVSDGLLLDTNYTVRIKATNAGAAMTGTVVASTSLGTLTMPASKALVGGELNATLRSSEPGTAYVNVRILDDNNKVILLANEAVGFSALIPAKITALAGRTTLDREETTEIVAKVLDKNDYPVRNQWVQFNVTGDTSGGGFTNGDSLVQTNADGIAIVSYTAGKTDTSKDSIRITASLVDYPAVLVKEPVLLTVSGAPVSVTLAAGNKISALDDTTYAYPYQVMVTNAAGGPVANQEVVLTVVPVYFLKGFYYYNQVAKSWLPKAIDRTTFLAITFGYVVSGADTVAEQPPIACPNEDTNLNGILDTGEDKNGDNKLWPGNPVTVSSKVVKTNASGYVNFDIIYGKSYANWLEVKLIASTRVAGSESTTERSFELPVLAADVAEQGISPPGGLRSPFGQSQAIIQYTADTTTTPTSYEPTSASIKLGSTACALKLEQCGVYSVGLP